MSSKASAGPSLVDQVDLAGLKRPPAEFKRDPYQAAAGVEDKRHEECNGKCGHQDAPNRGSPLGDDKPDREHENEPAEGNDRVQPDASDERPDLALEVQVTVGTCAFNACNVAADAAMAAHRTSAS